MVRYRVLREGNSRREKRGRWLFVIDRKVNTADCPTGNPFALYPDLLLTLVRRYARTSASLTEIAIIPRLPVIVTHSLFRQLIRRIVVPV